VDDGHEHWTLLWGGTSTVVCQWPPGIHEWDDHWYLAVTLGEWGIDLSLLLMFITAWSGDPSPGVTGVGDEMGRRRAGGYPERHEGADEGGHGCQPSRVREVLCRRVDAGGGPQDDDQQRYPDGRADPAAHLEHGAAGGCLVWSQVR
jgi:hypothetical protein